MGKGLLTTTGILLLCAGALLLVWNVLMIVSFGSLVSRSGGVLVFTSPPVTTYHEYGLLNLLGALIQVGFSGTIIVAGLLVLIHGTNTI